MAHSFSGVSVVTDVKPIRIYIELPDLPGRERDWLLGGWYLRSDVCAFGTVELIPDVDCFGMPRFRLPVAVAVHDEYMGPGECGRVIVLALDDDAVQTETYRRYQQFAECSDHTESIAERFLLYEAVRVLKRAGYRASLKGERSVVSKMCSKVFHTVRNIVTGRGHSS